MLVRSQFLGYIIGMSLFAHPLQTIETKYPGQSRVNPVFLAIQHGIITVMLHSTILYTTHTTWYELEVDLFGGTTKQTGNNIKTDGLTGTFPICSSKNFLLSLSLLHYILISLGNLEFIETIKEIQKFPVSQSFGRSQLPRYLEVPLLLRDQKATYL